MYNTKVYAARVKDRELLNKSSSGGMFTPLSDHALENGGAVVCAVYDYDDDCAKFRLVTCAEERDTALGSKYMQSIIGDIFVKCEKWLKENSGKKLMFFGMGCQAEAFRRFAEIKGFSERVYTVDIVCHGSPSPKIWREYAGNIRQKHGGNIEYLAFKDKRNGWNSPFAYVSINGKEIAIQDYVRVFYSKCTLRPSCHKCPYTTTERKTDITIGDYWGIEKVMPDFYSKEGNSLVLIHTEKGEKLFESIKEKLDFRISNTKDCLQPNLIKPTEVSPKREQFWKDHRNKGIEYVMKKYGTLSALTRIKRKIKKFIK